MLLIHVPPARVASHSLAKIGVQDRSLSLFAFLIIVLTGLSSGCRPAATDGPDGGVSIEWTDAIHVFENDTVVNVMPVVTLDPQGGYLVADEQENKIRRYRADGSLVWQRGRRGGGPGETQVAKGAVRAGPSGQVVAADENGRLIVLDSAGEHLRTLQLPITRVTGIAALPGDPTGILITGRGTTSESPPHVHVFNLETDSLVHSFFNPWGMGPSSMLAQTLGYVVATTMGDTIAVAYAPIDSIFYFNRSGERIGAVWIPSEGFRVPVDPSGTAIGDARARAQWLSTFETISHLVWLKDGALIVSYKTLGMRGATWHWVAMTPTGDLLAEHTDASRLLTSTDDPDAALLVHPDADAPNIWATLRFVH